MAPIFGDSSQSEKLSEIKPPLVEPQSSVYIICLVAGQCGMANKLRIMVRQCENRDEVSILVHSVAFCQLSVRSILISFCEELNGLVQY